MKPTKKEFTYGIEYRNKQGDLHREDGPAIEYNDGTKAWFINGIYYSYEEKWQQEVTNIKLKRILDL
jgi:hypothetical protein